MMELQDPPEMLVQKLKEWQRQQQEKLLREQQAQRALLSNEQRKLYQEYGLDNFGSVVYTDESEVRDIFSSMPAYTTNLTQESSLHASTSDPPFDNHDHTGSSSPSVILTSGRNREAGDCDAPAKQTLAFDDVPIPPPQKDFNQLLHEKLENKNDDNVNKKGKSSVVTKRPFLKKGEGLARYGLDANKLKKSQKSAPSSKSTSVSKPNVSDKSKTNIGEKKPASILKKSVSSSQYPGITGTIIKPDVNLRTARDVDSCQTLMPNNESSGLVQHATWAHVLMRKPEELPRNLPQATWSSNKPEELRNNVPHDTWSSNKPEELRNNLPQAVWSTNKPEILANNPQQSTWSTIMSQQSALSSNKPLQADKVALNKKELDELRVFELLEQKAANSSFCSTSSTIARLLERSPLSTPSKHSLSNVTHKDFDTSPQHHELERSLHIRFTENRCKTYKDSRDFQSTLYEDSMESAEDSLYERKDTLIQNSTSVAGSTGQTNHTDGKFIENGFQTFQYTETNFQDNVAWSDDCGCSSISEEEARSKSDSYDEESLLGVSGTFEQHSENCVIDLTIHTEPSQNKSTSPLAETPVTSAETAPPAEIVYKSDLLRKRLEELETEIEIFRKENANLARLKRSNELQEAKLNKERREFEKSFQEKEETLMNLLNSERKKLTNEKKVFERYCKDLKSQPSKAEREEIVALKVQVESLREELVTKDARWSATQVRTRDRVKHLESENTELKAQIHNLKREKQQAAKLNAARPSKVSDTKVMHAINSHIGRIKPSQLKNSVVMKNVPNKPTQSSVLTKASSSIERPIWGARNFKFRRTKSVPDVRPYSPPPSKTVIKNAPNLNRRYSADSSDNVDGNSDSDSEPEQPNIDTNAAQRFDKLQKTIYDTFYNNIPGFEQELGNNVLARTHKGRNSDENAKDSNPSNKKRVEFQTVPELVTSKPLYNRTTNMANEPGFGENSRLGSSVDSDEANPRFIYDPVPDKVSNGRHSIPNDEPSSLINPKHISSSVGEESAHASDSGTVIETVKPNGNREKSFADGRREIWYPNGNVKKISADKSAVKMIYFNGDVKETQSSDSTVKYYYAETKTWHSTYADGVEVLEFPNGQTERRTRDGLTEISFPNGSVRRCFSDGRDEWRLADGTRVQTSPGGEKVVQMPNGQREIHTLAHKRREYPDGTVKLVYPDGLQETRYSNGRIRLKDKAGKLIMDSSDVSS